MHKIILAASFTIFLASCKDSPSMIDYSEISDPIKRVRAAYQVDRLLAANTIRLEEDLRENESNFEYSSDFQEMTSRRRHHIVDLKNGSASSESLREISRTYHHGRQIIKDGRSWTIIYPTSSYQERGEADVLSLYGPFARASGALLAVWLDKAADSARLEGKEMWFGEQHDKVTFDFPNSSPLTILVQENTGYISKLSRQVGDIRVSYTFNYHELQNGIPIAREHSGYVNSERRYFSFNRNIILDDADDNNAFELESGLYLEPERVDQSAMTAEAVTDTIFQVGQNRTYTSFIKTQSGLVAFGVGAGFADRLKAYRDASNDTSPLAYAIAPSLHRARIMGAGEAAATGATLLVTPDAEARIASALDEAAKIKSISAPVTIDTLTIYNLETSNAAENLVVYNSADRTLIQSSHYSIPFVEAPILNELNAEGLRQRISELGLTPTHIVDTESKRIESWDVFETVVDSFDFKKCYWERKICEGWG
ncbi:MAG: hypothetical protein ABJN69_14440 [Hellea sp.]